MARARARAVATPHRLGHHAAAAFWAGGQRGTAALGLRSTSTPSSVVTTFLPNTFKETLHLPPLSVRSRTTYRICESFTTGSVSCGGVGCPVPLNRAAVAEIRAVGIGASESMSLMPTLTRWELPLPVPARRELAVLFRADRDPRRMRGRASRRGPRPPRDRANARFHLTRAPRFVRSPGRGESTVHVRPIDVSFRRVASVPGNDRALSWSGASPSCNEARSPSARRRQRMARRP
jgi:hypothetical protein